MRRSGFIAAVALLVAAVGVIIALAAYFKNRSSCLLDEEDFMFDDPDDLDYYTAEVEEEFAQEDPPASEQAPASDSEQE